VTSPNDRQDLLRHLPGVDQMLLRAQSQQDFQEIPRAILVEAIRETLDGVREGILSNHSITDKKLLDEEWLMAVLGKTLNRLLAPNLRHLVNATGVVIHTNLGRSLLAEAALAQVNAVAGSYSNLEFDLETGRRGSRYSIVEKLLCKLSGAEAAIVVNNNAAAVLLCLDTMAREKEAIVSRGELVEIGGSFRIPDVMAKSGALLKEVGTTNRTHLKDYRNAIGSNTGLLLKVHTSNFQVVGFTASVQLRELVELGRQFHIPVMEDLGSGTLIDFSKYGLTREPTVQESVTAGADLVTFSGDKLLGGPQAGIILGKEETLRRIKENPLTRALRIDKLTLAALEGTLRLYLDEKRAVADIPTLQMLTLSEAQAAEKAASLADMLGRLDSERLDIRILERPGKAGGGSLPLLDLPGSCLALHLEGFSAASLENAMRRSDPPIIGRIEMDTYLLDLRTVKREEFVFIEKALGRLLNRNETGRVYDRPDRTAL
jgi:L-seryl-tRNA(Ser) seleniumtransferase